MILYKKYQRGGKINQNLNEVKAIVSNLYNIKKYQTGGDIAERRNYFTLEGYEDRLYSLADKYNFSNLDTAVANIASNQPQPEWLQQELNDSGIDVDSSEFKDLIANSPFYFAPEKETKQPYIKKVLGNTGPANLFYVNAKGDSIPITQAALQSSQYVNLPIKEVNYYR